MAGKFGQDKMPPDKCDEFLFDKMIASQFVQCLENSC